jgi:Zn-dependent peptidase ImmA (M78 family)
LTPPYSPEEAVRLLGGSIEYDTDTKAIDAYIRKTAQNSFEVSVTNDSPHKRNRFSLAHELGHLFLHMGYLINDELWNSIPNTDPGESVYYRGAGNYTIKEKEADEFAAAFLMPKEDFRKQVFENLHNNKIDIEKVAAYFDVSVQAASVRAKWLGYAEW